MIKMLVSTYYKGKSYKKDNYYSIDIDTEARWLKNRIAESAMTDEEKLNAMTEEELRQYAAEQSVTIPGNVTKRETIIDIILKHRGE